ncbi:hypothetical protein ACFUCQ_35755 [Streptomyces sp. NPDC057197]|uniref:hypothetical protein n=1 Tax=Streptomyces sp. NPDC057197 TaxID=3346045 RepID=UPI00363077DD
MQDQHRAAGAGRGEGEGQVGVHVRRVVRATFQSEQAFGTLVGRLASQGLVERTPGRGRRIEHHLTPAGERVLASGHQVADEVLASCFAALSDDDREQLLLLLRRLTSDDGA